MTRMLGPHVRRHASVAAVGGGTTLLAPPDELGAVQTLDDAEIS